MSFKSTVLAAVAASLFAVPALAEGIMVKDPYARASSAKSTSGAAFMTIMNHSGQDDRLIAATTSAAKRAELHTHKEDANGVMQMLHIEEGFAVADGGMLELKRGGKHVMLMGLTAPFEQDKMLSLTLSFEHAGDVVVELPVDLARKPGKDAHGDHAGHGEMKH